MPEPAYIEAGATFSPDDVYRFRLWRVWAPGRRVCFLMLNPSIADERQLDPTLRRCLGFAQRWGAGSFEVANLFALRSTDPRALRRHPDPVGNLNDAHIAAAAARASVVVAGWGVHGSLGGRASQVITILKDRGVPLYCLGVTKDGAPRHPLYLRGDLEPVRLDLARAA